MKYYLFLFAILSLVTGCEKEEQPLPSGLEDEWFVVHDNPGNALQHRVFEIYSDWGIPVFYNDTIGRQERGIDRNGHPIVFWKILDLNYNLNNPVNIGSLRTNFFSRVKEEKERMAGLNFVDDVLLPALSETFYLHSILLTDSLYEEGSNKNKYFLKVYRSLETLAIADIPAIAAMSGEEKQVRANEILTYLAAQYLNKSKLAEIAAFRKVSYDPVKQRTYYGMEVCTPRYPGYISLPPARWEVYGFLDYDRTKSAGVTDPDPVNWWYYAPKEDADIEDFIMAVLSSDGEEFAALYGSYPKVMEKYALMKKLMAIIGFAK